MASELQNAQAKQSVAPFPTGRRTPRGALRWYPVRVPEGREAASAERLRKLVSADVLEDAFSVQRERWFKHAGAWSVQTVPLYRGYVFAASRDAAGLGQALAQLGLRDDVHQPDGRLAPLADDVRAWIAASMDEQRVVRASEGVIEGGKLRVTRGPLTGRESAVVKIDRHRRTCTVRVEGKSGAVEHLALNVPVKS